MSSPTILQRLGTKAKDVTSTLKSLPPSDSEAQGIAETQKQVDALHGTSATAQAPAPSTYVPTEAEKASPLTRYGSRPGEKRLDTSYTEQPTAVKAPVYDRGGEVGIIGGTNNNARPMPTMHLPAYDNGGEVKTAEPPPLPAGYTRLPSVVEPPPLPAGYHRIGEPAATPEYTPRYSAEAAVANRPKVGMPKIHMDEDRSAYQRSPLPMYDNGGDVKVLPEDHKMTVKAGPDKPEDYLSRYGSEAAVANRPEVAKPTVGMKPIPVYDEGTPEVDVNDGEHQAAILKNGERVLTPEENEQYKAEHQGATKAEAPSPALKTQDAKSTEEGQPLAPKPEAAGASASETPKLTRLGGSVAEPKAQPEVAQQPPVEEKPKRTIGQPLGEAWLKRMGVHSPIDLMKAPDELNQGSQGVPNVEGGMTKPDALTSPAAPSQAPQGGMKPMALPEDKTATPALSGKDKYAAKIKDYDTKYQSLLDKAAETNDPALREQAARVKEAKLEYEKSHPWGSPESAHPGILGKIGHVAEMVASRTPGLAPIVGTLPGSEMYRANEMRGNREDVKEDTAAATARSAEEAKAAPAPKLLGGEGNTAVAPDGTRYQRYEMQDHTARWAKEGEVPTMASSGTPPQGAKQEGAAPAAAPTIGNQPNIAEHPAVQASLPQGTVVGKPPVTKEGEEPATPAQLNDVTSRLQNNPYVPKEAVSALQFPEGYKPTQNDVKERLANIKEIEDATRQGKQDEAMNALRKMQESNQALMTQAHLADMEDKHQQAQAKEAMNASVSLAGLYAQQNYKDEMGAWYKSGNFAKDSGLITEIVNKEHSDKGAFSSVVGDSLVGSLFGPEGTAIGAGVGALTGLFAGPANGYLDTLKKQGISEEGYNAMQSYFNALPARMAYEISVQGVSASAMRSQQLIQKVLNTVPPPNTPQESFDANFNRYYTPMDVLTKKKVELSAPKGYVPPKKEDLYPPKAAPTTKGAEVPREGNAKFHVGNAKGEIFSNDGKTWYDAQGKLIKNK